MTTTNAAEQSGASRGGLPARHPPRRDDHPRETTSGEGVVLSSKRAERMLADRRESLDRTKRSPAHLGELEPAAKGGSIPSTEMPRGILERPAATPTGCKDSHLYSPMAHGGGE